MLLSRDYLGDLLARALEQVPVSADAGIALEGSIAEGFGNESSDIDFVVLEESGRDFPTVPVQLFIDERRVEIRRRSLADARRDAATLRDGSATERQLTALSYSDLDRWQRLAGAVILRNAAMIEPVQGLVPEQHLQAIVSRWFAVLARESCRCAVALAGLGQVREALGWAQAALHQAAKSWLAAQGETYLPMKWLSQQFERLSHAEDTYATYTRLATSTADGADDGARVAECVAFVAELGVKDCEADARQVALALLREVTTWQVGQRLYVVRARRDIFALSRNAELAWRSLAFGVPLQDVLLRCPLDATEAGWLIAEFHRLGLVSLRWSRGGVITARGVSSPPPGVTRPVISLGEAGQPTEDAQPIELCALPAPRFATAGMALVWANVEIENAREDARGAVASEQWQVVQTIVQRLARKAATVVLSAYGVVTLPTVGTREREGLSRRGRQGGERDEEACSRLRATPGVPADLAHRLALLERTPSVRTELEAQQVMEELDEVIGQVRELVGASSFPSSFDSSAGWRETVEIGYDWMRLGAYLDSTFPLDEARDVLAGGTGR